MFEDKKNQRSELHDAHNLLPLELRSTIPPLYAQEEIKDPIVYAKFFTPDSSWTWYVTEGQPDGEDFRFFGYVIGFEKEWESGDIFCSLSFNQREDHSGFPLRETYILDQHP